MSFAEILSEAISRANLSLRKIAELCNVNGFSIDHSYISKLKNGKLPPPSEEMSRVLAGVLSIDPELLVIEGYKEKAPDEIKALLRGVDVNSDRVVLTKHPGEQHFTRQPGRMKRYSMVLELADILQNKDILVTASGEPLEEQSRLNLLDNLNKPATGQCFSIPILGTIRAGIPLLSEQNIVGKVELTPEMKGRADFALLVNGDSMIGAGIGDGDTVLCKKSKTPNHGQVVMALVNNNETTLKYFIKEKGRLLLRAANPEYKDLELHSGDIIQGYVVGIRKEPPTMNTYREYIYFRDEHLQQWNEVIEEAAAYGIKPAAVRELINLQVELAKRLAGR